MNGSTFSSSITLMPPTKMSVTNESVTNVVSAPLLGGDASDELTYMFQYVLDLWICSFLSFLGLIDNVIAIVVFAKMGFQDTINISLTAIAFWDVVKCLCNALMRMYGPIQLASEFFAQIWASYTMIYLGYVYSMAGYVSSMMAGYVAVERCLCVTLPFTVKFLLTRKVVTAMNIVISVGVISSYVLIYSTVTIKWVYNTEFNVTQVFFSFSDFHYKYPTIDRYIMVMSVLYPFLSFIVMSICTVIIIYQLRKASKIRKTTTSNNAGKQNQISSRDRQITKMLLVVISVYIISYVPRLSHYFTTIFVPEFQPGDRYNNYMWIVTYIMFLFDLVNSAINPFILFLMSSQFKETFLIIFSLTKKK